MDTKLTLSLDEAVIKKVKAFAKENHTSLFQLFENYLNSLTFKEKQSEEDISPLVRSLSGVLMLPGSFDYNDDRANYLEKKYK